MLREGCFRGETERSFLAKVKSLKSSRSQTDEAKHGAMQMALVVKAGLLRDPGWLDSRAQQGAGQAQPAKRPEGVGRKAELTGENAIEALRAQPGKRGQFALAQGFGGIGLDPLQGAPHGGVRAGEGRIGLKAVSRQGGHGPLRPVPEIVTGLGEGEPELEQLGVVRDGARECEVVCFRQSGQQSRGDAQGQIAVWSSGRGATVGLSGRDDHEPPRPDQKVASGQRQSPRSSKNAGHAEGAVDVPSQGVLHLPAVDDGEPREVPGGFDTNVAYGWSGHMDAPNRMIVARRVRATRP